MKKITLLIGLLFWLSPLASAYSDVSGEHQFATAIDYITDLGIVQGYDDGTYRPENTINRAEFTKILVEAKTGVNPVDFVDACFNDFSAFDWFSSYVCYAKVEGIIDGYPDGSFGPGKSINVAESSKILVNVFEIDQVETSGSEWYSGYVETLLAEKFIPDSVEYINSEITRGEMAEMIWRIMEDKHDQSAATVLGNSPCQELGEDLPANINMDVVRETVLGWYNDERRLLGLHEYVLNDQLSRSATNWSEVSEARGYMDHKRNVGDAYYDWQKIKSWFADLGLEFSGSLFTENIAWEMYYCDVAAENCTQEMIDSVRKGFNFFMSEKGGSYTAHYDSIVSPHFTEMGIGIAVNDVTNKYYLTVHYGSDIISDPMRICL